MFRDILPGWLTCSGGTTVNALENVNFKLRHGLIYL